MLFKDEKNESVKEELITGISITKTKELAENMLSWLWICENAADDILKHKNDPAVISYYKELFKGDPDFCVTDKGTFAVISCKNLMDVFTYEEPNHQYLRVQIPYGDSILDGILTYNNYEEAKVLLLKDLISKYGFSESRKQTLLKAFDKPCDKEIKNYKEAKKKSRENYGRE